MVMLDTILSIEIQKNTHSTLHEVDFSNLKFGQIFADHMLVADYKDGHWVSCKIQPFGEMKMSPALAVLHYGQTIFEGLKAYKNEKGEISVFRPDQNYQRMLLSAERMCMPAIPEEFFMNGLRQLLELDKDWIPEQEGCTLYIRPFMFGSEAFLGVRPSNEYKFIIFNSPVGSYYSEPVRVKIEDTYSRVAPGGVGSSKNGGNYAASLFPARLAQEQGYHQVLWTDAAEHKYIEESGTMNVAFRVGNTIITPAIGDTILDGVTRKSVMHLARHWGYNVEERKVTVSEIVEHLKNNTLDEAFGLGTAATIAHITTICHKETDYALPAVETRTFSNKVLQYLTDLKYGRIADEFDWMMKI
jgi:branched-chain amino acid aminotransferase